MIRYFRAVDAVYEAARSIIDAAMNYPSADTETIWTPAIYATHDAEGRCLLALWPELAELQSVANALPPLEEISEGEFRKSLPQEPLP